MDIIIYILIGAIVFCIFQIIVQMRKTSKIEKQHKEQKREIEKEK